MIFFMLVIGKTNSYAYLLMLKYSNVLLSLKTKIQFRLHLQPVTLLEVSIRNGKWSNMLVGHLLWNWKPQFVGYCCTLLSQILITVPIIWFGGVAKNYPTRGDFLFLLAAAEGQEWVVIRSVPKCILNHLYLCSIIIIEASFHLFRGVIP